MSAPKPKTNPHNFLFPSSFPKIDNTPEQALMGNSVMSELGASGGLKCRDRAFARGH